MGEASYTPGPWLAPSTPRPDGLRQTVEQHHSGRVVAVCDPGRGASQFRIRGDEAWANACLIAAAPELLVALRCASLKLRRYRQQHPDTWVGGVEAEYQAVLALADAAIAKAEGLSR